MTLASEDGWTLRNDLSLGLDEQLREPSHQLYAGLDVGRVGGAIRCVAVRPHAGRRGDRPARPHRPAAKAINASYDMSAGWPLKKPDNLKTQSTVFAATLIFEF